MLSDLCRAKGAMFIVNDDVALALACNADGVHLGQADMALADARAQLGDGAIIGITCHDSVELALKAQAGGADYVAFGSFYPSPSKPCAADAPIDILRQARQDIGLPIVAIGGITAGNAEALITAGADMLAVIHGVFAQEDVEKAARAYAGLFSAKNAGSHA